MRSYTRCLYTRHHRLSALVRKMEESKNPRQYLNCILNVIVDTRNYFIAAGFPNTICETKF